MEHQNISAAFDIALHRVFGIVSGVRLSAGGSDHIEDEKFAILIPLTVFQYLPGIFRKDSTLFQIFGKLLKEFEPAMLVKMRIRKKIDHLRLLLPDLPPG